MSIDVTKAVVPIVPGVSPVRISVTKALVIAVITSTPVVFHISSCPCIEPLKIKLCPLC